MNNLENMKKRLRFEGGDLQQSRMIRDKLLSLKSALKYSYQGANVKISNQTQMHRALINPNLTKMDYDEKIFSIPFDSGVKVGDIFEWLGTNTHWLVYSQDLTELAYFRSDIRKCTEQISWIDEDTGEIFSTYAVVRGPVETKINFIQKSGISVDTPNHSLNILMPRTKETVSYFDRYAKFYLSNMDDYEQKICWRVEGFDSISTPGILEITAVEYYANKDEDDIENELVGGLIVKPVVVESDIKGEGFIKPFGEYEYTCLGEGEWTWDRNCPLEAEVDGNTIKIKWTKGYSGSFELSFGDIKRTIVVESLF